MFTFVDTARGPVAHTVTFFNRGTCVPSSLVAQAIAAYTNSKGEPRTAQCDIHLPLSFLCKLVPPIKNSSAKVTMDTNKGPVGMNAIFGDFMQGADTSAAAVNVISFSYFNGSDCTIIVSKNAGRYRIQGSSLEALWIVTQELCDRLTAYFNGMNDKEPLKISHSEDLPLNEYFNSIEEHWRVSSYYYITLVIQQLAYQILRRFPSTIN